MAKFLVSDDLWAVIGPLLSPARVRPEGGRPLIPDRAALTGILLVLRTGLPWEYLPQEMGCVITNPLRGLGFADSPVGWAEAILSG